MIGRRAAGKGIHVIAVVVLALLLLGGWCLTDVAAEGLNDGAATVLLRRDTGLAVSYWPSWQVGDEVALLLPISPGQFPLTLQGAEVLLHAYEGASETLTLVASVHVSGEDGPGPELVRSNPIRVTLGTAISKTVSLPFTARQVTLIRPQPLYVVIRYAAAAGPDLASLYFDATAAVPSDQCLYRHAGGTWDEHHDFWVQPEQVGYPMIRLRGVTSGLGIDDRTYTQAGADTMLVERIPDLNQGDQSYMEVGSDDVWSAVHPLVRFPLPAPPVSGAQPSGATLRVYHYQTASEAEQTLPLTVTAHAITRNWAEGAATWDTMAGAWESKAVGTAVIPVYDELVGPREYMVSWDVTAAFAAWWGGASPCGIALVGWPGQEDGLRHLGSRERLPEVERPVLIVKWDLGLQNAGHTLYMPIVRRK